MKPFLAEGAAFAAKSIVLEGAGAPPLAIAGAPVATFIAIGVIGFMALKYLSWRQEDKEVQRERQENYDRFCRDLSSQELATKSTSLQGVSDSAILFPDQNKDFSLLQVITYYDEEENNWHQILAQQDQTFFRSDFIKVDRTSGALSIFNKQFQPYNLQEEPGEKQDTTIEEGSSSVGCSPGGMPPEDPEEDPEEDDKKEEASVSNQDNIQNEQPSQESCSGCSDVSSLALAIAKLTEQNNEKDRLIIELLKDVKEVQAFCQKISEIQQASMPHSYVAMAEKIAVKCFSYIKDLPGSYYGSGFLLVTHFISGVLGIITSPVDLYNSLESLCVKSSKLCRSAMLSLSTEETKFDQNPPIRYHNAETVYKKSEK